MPNGWFGKRGRIKPAKMKFKVKKSVAALSAFLTVTAAAWTPATLFEADATRVGIHAEAYDPNSILERRNVLTYSEDFSNAAWSATASSITSGQIAPDGTSTASKLVESATVGGHYIRQSVTTSSDKQHTFSVYLKAGERSWSRVLSFVTNTTVWFDLASGTVGTVQAGVLAHSMEAVGGGWYRCSVTFAGNATHVYVSSEIADGGSSYAGDGTSSIYLWAAQLEVGTAPTEYQKVTDWNTEFLAACAAQNFTRILYNNSTRTIPVTAVEQAIGSFTDWSPGAYHGTQASSPSRAVLSARYNLLTKTEQFDDATWLKTNCIVTANSINGPTGELNADLITLTGAPGVRHIHQTAAILANTPSEMVVCAKIGTHRYIQLINAADATLYGNFDLLNGVIGTNGANTVASIENLGDGWYRCKTRFTGGTIGSNWRIYGVDGAAAAFNSGSTSTGTFYLWGADLRYVADLNIDQPTYQRVNTATDYDTVGFKHYFKLDGTDDSWQTPVIPFAGNNFLLCASINKLSDAAFGVVFETSANATSTAGCVLLGAPIAASATVGLYSRGTATAAVSFVQAAPANMLLTTQSKISTDLCSITKDDGAASTVVTDQGAGDYTAQVANIGRRNNTGNPFNGRIYALTAICGGADLTADELANLKQYHADKAGRTLTFI